MKSRFFLKDGWIFFFSIGLEIDFFLINCDFEMFLAPVLFAFLRELDTCGPQVGFGVQARFIGTAIKDLRFFFWED